MTPTEGLVLAAFALPERGEFGPEAFGQIGSVIAACTSRFLATYNDVVSVPKPSEIVIEFGVVLDVEGGLLKVVHGSAAADLKLRFVWRAAPDA